MSILFKNNWKPLHKKIALICFCILIGSLCFFTLIRSLQKGTIRNHIIVLTRLGPGLQIPMSATATDSLIRQWLKNINQTPKK